MKAVRNTLFAVLFLSSSAFAATGKSNCQAQAPGTMSKDKRQQAAEAIRVYEGNAKPAPRSSPEAGKAISEKGS